MSKRRNFEMTSKMQNPFDERISKEELMFNLNEIDEKNILSKFKATDDPINYAFDAIEKTSLKTLARDFIKESFFGVVSFITSICK